MQTAQTPHLCENQIGTIVLNWGHAPGKGIFGIKNTKGSNPFRIFVKSLLFVPRWKKCLTCISSYFLFVFFSNRKYHIAHYCRKWKWRLWQYTKQGRHIWQGGSQGKNPPGGLPPDYNMFAHGMKMMELFKMFLTSSTMWTAARTTQ